MVAALSLIPTLVLLTLAVVFGIVPGLRSIAVEIAALRREHQEYRLMTAAQFAELQRERRWAKNDAEREAARRPKAPPVVDDSNLTPEARELIAGIRKQAQHG